MKNIFILFGILLLASCKFIVKEPKYNSAQVKTIIMKKDCEIYSEEGLSLFKCNNDIAKFDEIFLKTDISDKIFIKDFDFIKFICAVSYNGSVRYDKKMYCSKSQLKKYKNFMMENEPEEYRKLISVHNAVKKIIEQEGKKAELIKKNAESAQLIFNSKLIYEYNEVFNKQVKNVADIEVELNNNLGSSLVDFNTRLQVSKSFWASRSFWKKNVDDITLDDGRNVVYSLSKATIKEIGDNYIILFLTDDLAKPYERFPLQKIIIENPKPFKLNELRDLKYREHYVVYVGNKQYKSLFGSFKLPKFKIITDKVYLLDSIQSKKINDEAGTE